MSVRNTACVGDNDRLDKESRRLVLRLQQPIAAVAEALLKKRKGRRRMNGEQIEKIVEASV